MRYISKNAFKFLNNITEIEIRNNTNLTLSNFSLASLESLNKLSIVNSNLKKIDDKILEGLKNIKEINFSGNKIENLSFINSSLVNLSKLNLTQNKITKIEKLHDLAMINEINLSHNDIRMVNSHSFYRNPNLKRLDLSFNKITFISNYSFYFSDTLKFLNLNNNPIENIEALAFYKLDYLNELLIQNTHLSKLEFEVLSKSNVPKLIILNLKNNFFSAKYNLKNAFGETCRTDINFENDYFSCWQ